MSKRQFPIVSDEDFLQSRERLRQRWEDIYNRWSFIDSDSEGELVVDPITKRLRPIPLHKFIKHEHLLQDFQSHSDSQSEASETSSLDDEYDEDDEYSTFPSDGENTVTTDNDSDSDCPTDTDECDTTLPSVSGALERILAPPDPFWEPPPLPPLSQSRPQLVVDLFKQYLLAHKAVWCIYKGQLGMAVHTGQPGGLLQPFYELLDTCIDKRIPSIVRSLYRTKSRYYTVFVGNCIDSVGAIRPEKSVIKRLQNIDHSLWTMNDVQIVVVQYR